MTVTRGPCFKNTVNTGIFLLVLTFTSRKCPDWERNTGTHSGGKKLLRKSLFFIETIFLFTWFLIFSEVLPFFLLSSFLWASSPKYKIIHLYGMFKFTTIRITVTNFTRIVKLRRPDKAVCLTICHHHAKNCLDIKLGSNMCYHKEHLICLWFNTSVLWPTDTQALWGVCGCAHCCAWCSTDPHSSTISFWLKRSWYVFHGWMQHACCCCLHCCAQCETHTTLLFLLLIFRMKLCSPILLTNKIKYRVPSQRKQAHGPCRHDRRFPWTGRLGCWSL